MEEVQTNVQDPVVAQGSAGLNSQVGNQPTTVSGAAEASGGVGAGNLIQPDIDDDLFKFSSDDTPLMNLMLKAKTVNVASPEVDHYSIDEPTAMVTVASVSGNAITLVGADKMKLHAYDTLAVVGVHGYSHNGTTNVETTRPLQLYVIKVDDDDTVTVRADNGIKSAATDEYGDLPSASSPSQGNTNYIKAGTKMIILGNALYETQKEVDPDLVLPEPERQYLQKRGMNQIVSDYFESQKKRIPFSQSIIAEAAIRNFKVKGNRTLWIGQKSKMRVKAKKTGDMQYVYKTEGIRWQFKRELEHTGAWSYDDFIDLLKIYHTGEDVPNSCLALIGANAQANINKIDWSKHPEVKFEMKTTKIGWKLPTIITSFGEVSFKREPTLDRLGYSNCMALIGEDRLVHYKRVAEHQFKEKVEGEEATRSGVLVWDALCLKGSCHIWVDGKGDETAPGATEFLLWNEATEPQSPKNNTVYYFQKDVSLAAISGKSAAISAKAGEMYKYTTANGWESYSGAVQAA